MPNISTKLKSRRTGSSSDDSSISLGDFLLGSGPGSSTAWIISSMDISSTGFSGASLRERTAGLGLSDFASFGSSFDFISAGLSLVDKRAQAKQKKLNVTQGKTGPSS